VHSGIKYLRLEKGNWKMKKLIIVSCVVLFACLPIVASAATNDELSSENAALKARLDRLEKELTSIRGLVEKKSTTAGKPINVPAISDADLTKLSEMVTKKKASGVTVTPYGFIKADAIYDNSQVSVGNFIKWVESEGTGGDNDEFNMTANQTRLGLKINGPQSNGLNMSGVVELDFYGGQAENKSHMFMRHAYMKMAWPEERFSIIAGQTWDVISPLNPGTLNYSVAWWAGNIGYRRPQIRLTKSYALSDSIDLKLEGALARNIGTNGSDSFATGTVDSGQTSGQPMYQGRSSVTFPLLSYKPTTVGFSGHWGKEKFDKATPAQGNKFNTWSLNLDVAQPVNEWLTIKGEFFKGENLSQFLGGIGQGINTGTGNEIGTKGGWIAASIGPFDKWRFNTGFTMEDVDRDDLSNAVDQRTLNSSIFGNMIYAFNKNTEVGLEVSRWRTDYKNQADGDDLRLQSSFIYKF
jgi:hypothetical protein